MAWNKPSADAEQAKAKKLGEQRNVRLSHGLIAAAVVVIGAAGFYFAFHSSTSTSKLDSASVKTKRIREVTPAATPKVVPQVEMVTNRFGMVVPKKEKKTYVDERGVRRYMNGQRCYEGVKMRPKPPPRAPSSIFKHASEREIEALITLDGGGRLFGDRNYGPRFVEDFKKSCEEPIIVSQDDPESVKALKRAMNEAKIDLKNRLDNGEDISKIMKDAYDESMRLAAYKDEMEKLVREQIREGEHTDEDCRDLVASANKILAEKGIAPISGGSIIRMNLKLRRNRELKEEK